MASSIYAANARRPGFQETGAALVVGSIVLLVVAVGAVAGSRPDIALLALVGAALVPIVLRSPTVGLCALTVLSFLEAYSAISGAVSASKALGVLLVVSWLAAAATAGRREPRPHGFVHQQQALSMLLVLFASWACMSMLWAESSGAAQSAVIRYALNFLLFPLCFLAIRSSKHVLWLIVCFVGGSLAAALLGLATGAVDDADRLKGAGLNPNQLGSYLVASAVFAAVLASNRRWPPGARTAALITAGLCGLALLMTGSRGALVGFAAALFVAPLVLGRGRRLGALALVVLTTAGGVWWYAAIAPAAAVERITHPEQGGGSGREDLWRVGWRMSEAHPVAGVGAGNFPESSVHYLLEPGRTDRDEIIVDEKKVAHNIYLTVLSELGAVGLLFFLGILAFCLRACLRAARRFAEAGNDVMELAARSLLIALVGLLVTGFFSSALFSKQFWLLLALGPAMLALATRQPRAHRAGISAPLRLQGASTRAAVQAPRGAPS